MDKFEDNFGASARFFSPKKRGFCFLTRGAQSANNVTVVLLMEEILHHLGWLKPYK